MNITHLANNKGNKMLKQEVDLLLEDFTIELTEAQLEYLVENRIEFIKNANRDKISTEHDPESANLTSDKIVDHIANKIDPTARKEHTQWLVNRYKNGEFKLSDSKDLKKTMSRFEESKGYLENKNLNDMKSLSQLKDNLAVTTTKTKIENKNSKENQVKPMPVVFENDEATGYEVPNKSTSIHNYGPAGKMCKTGWCTASTNANMFSGYPGGKYTLHLKNGSVLQLHHQSNQLKDEDDHEIDLNTNKRYSDYKGTIAEFIRKTHELEGRPESGLMKRIPMKSEHLQELLDNHARLMTDPKTSRWSDSYKNSKQAIETAISNNADISDKQFEQLKSIPEFNSDYRSNGEIIGVDKTQYITKNKYAKPHHLDQIADQYLKEGKFGSSSYIDQEEIKPLLYNPNTSGDTHHKIISEFVKSYGPNHATKVEKYISSAHNFEPEHFKRLEHLPNAKAQAVLNQNTSSKLPEDYYEGTDEGYMTNLAHRHDINEKTAQHILDNAKTKKPIFSLVNNPRTPKDHMLEALHQLKGNTSQDISFDNIMKHEDLTDEDVSRILSSYMGKNHKTNYNGFPMTSTRLSREHIRSVIRHPNFTQLGTNVIRNPKIKSDDLDLALESDKDGDIASSTYLNSPALKSKHIDKLIAREGMTNPLAEYLTDSSNDNPTYIAHVTPGHLHAILDSDVNMQNKHRVLHQPGVQVSHFEKVKNNPKFFGAISSSENAPPSILHSLATSPMDHVRLNVAENPNTESRTYQILKNDQNPDVAKIAQKKVK